MGGYETWLCQRRGGGEEDSCKLGNMLFNERVKDDMGLGEDQEKAKKVEHRIFPEHMYTGPLKLGDPFYRGLTKMETDPMLPARMRDTARSELCTDVVKSFTECTQRAGFGLVYACRKERDDLVACIDTWMQSPDFKDQVTEEYLNERSHFRETGVKTKRYHRGTFIARDESIDGPPLDKNGVYRPRKPRDWDKHYAESGPPKWANFDYAKRED